jgi:hypothetical protein
MADNVAAPSVEKVEKAKKWAMLKFRESLRGARVTEQIQRFLSGELPEYRFQVELVLDERTKTFIEDSKNTEKLDNEKLV